MCGTRECLVCKNTGKNATLTIGMLLPVRDSAAKRISLAATCIGPMQEASNNARLGETSRLSKRGKIWLTTIPWLEPKAAKVTNNPQKIGFLRTGTIVYSR